MNDDISFEGAEPRRRKSAVSRSPIDRLPPHSQETEQACLGCILIEPGKSLDECMVAFGDTGENVFYDLRHQTIYKSVVEMSILATPIDTITLQQFLKDKSLLEQVGGLPYISQLPDCTPSAVNVGEYCEILLNKYKLRRLIHACTDIVSKVYETEGEVDQILDQAEREVMSVRTSSARGGAVQMREPIMRAIRTIEDYDARSGMLLGIPTGFHDLDMMTGGLIESQMVVIAARPSIGKTSLCMNIAENVAIESKLAVGVFSLEMTTDSLALRMLCSRSRVNVKNVRDGFLAERDYPKLTGAAGKLSAAPIYIDDQTGLSIMELRARARRMISSFGIKLFVIDYLQLLTATINGKRIEKREREVSEISAGIRALSKELKVPIIAVSQLNRQIDREKRKPTMADLRESGSLEQDADLIGLLYRPKSDDEDAAPAQEDSVAVNLEIAKQRNGPCDVVKLTFIKSYTRFESAAKVSDEDSPDQCNFPYQQSERS